MTIRLQFGSGRRPRRRASRAPGVRTVGIASCALALFTPMLGFAQDVTSAPAKTAAAIAPNAEEDPNLDFSGVLYGSFQYGGAPGSRSNNQFALDRAYLTFKMPTGERASVRVTADVFQQTSAGADDYYRGWTFRVKYAYLQYQYRNPTASGVKGYVQAGAIPTVIIGQVESFWPRWVSSVATEKAGYFSSADIGISSEVSLPHKLGNVYTSVTNGNGYASRETDRFKDYAARVTLTPFAKQEGVLKTLTIAPWAYKGLRASSYARQTGTVLPVAAGRQRDRFGLFAGLKHDRFVAGAHVAGAREELEQADTLSDAEPTVSTEMGSVYSAFAHVHPFAGTAGAGKVGLLFRYDRTSPPRLVGDSHTTFTIAALTYDLNSKVTIAVTNERRTTEPYVRSQDSNIYALRLVANY